MPSPRLPAVLAAAAVVAAAGLAATAVPAQAKEPPACAAVSFRTIAPGGPDGQQEAGLYKSRFGKIEIRTDVKGGQGAHYVMVLNGKTIEGPANPPKLSESCLKSKHVKVPFAKQPAGSCTGSRFRVVIDRSGGKAVAAFFGLQGDDWAYCSATTL